MNTASPIRTFYRANEVGPLVGVSGSTVRRWVRDGILKPTFITPGGQYRFTLEDVREQVAALHPRPWNPEEHRKADS